MPQRARLFDQLPCAAGVVEPHIGDGATLLLGGLRRDPGPGVLLREASVLDQPFHPEVFVGVDDHHQREHRRHPGFHQKRDVLHDHGVFSGLDGTSDQL